MNISFSPQPPRSTSRNARALSLSPRKLTAQKNDNESSLHDKQFRLQKQEYTINNLSAPNLNHETKKRPFGLANTAPSALLSTENDRNSKTFSEKVSATQSSNANSIVLSIPSQRPPNPPSFTLAKKTRFEIDVDPNPPPTISNSRPIIQSQKYRSSTSLSKKVADGGGYSDDLQDFHAWSDIVEVPSTLGLSEQSFSSSLSSESTLYSSLTLLEALEKLDEARQLGERRYFHVTPRFNVQYVKKMNFYDVVILEVPGFPKTGVVWARAERATIGGEPLLPKEQLMQLSLEGLTLVGGGDNNDGKIGEFIPLRSFLMERKQLNILRQKQFFGKFHELKYFRYLLIYTLRNRKKRVSALLLDATMYSDEPLLKAMQKIRELTFYLENNVELFAPQKRGAINLKTFLTSQSTHIIHCKDVIVNVVQTLVQMIETQYEVLMSESYLKEKTEDIFKHHPYAWSEYMKATTGSLMEGWTDIRAVQRSKEQFLAKTARLFLLSQFMVDGAIMGLLEDFWLKIAQLIRGVRRVNSEPSPQGNNNGEIPLGVCTWNVRDAPTEDMFAGIDILADRLKKMDRDKTLQVSSSYDMKSLSRSASEDGRPGSAGGRTSRPGSASSRSPSLTSNSVGAVARQMNRDLFGANGGRGPESRMTATPPIRVDANSSSAQKLRSTRRRSSLGIGDEALKSATSKQGGTRAATASYQRENAQRLRGSAQELVNENLQEDFLVQDSVSVLKEWQDEGLHLCVEVTLCRNDHTAVDFDSLTSGKSAAGFRLKVLPTKVDTATLLNDLFDKLGDFLAAIPPLRSHKLRKSENDEKKFQEEEDHFDALASSQLQVLTGQDSSNKYFAHIANHSQSSFRESFKQASDCLHQWRAAYVEASLPSTALRGLYDLFLKLWELDTAVLCEQLERSHIIGKLKELVGNAEDIKDVPRALQKDRSRLKSLVNASDHLRRVHNVLTLYEDQKHSCGFITSFRLLIGQLRAVRTLQAEKLFTLLPTSYAMRCRQVIEFTSRLERLFMGSGDGLSDLTAMMRRLKNFDACKYALDDETDLSETVYRLIERQVNEGGEAEDMAKKMTLADVGVAEAFVIKATLFIPQAPAIRQVFLDNKDRLVNAAARCRIFLTRQLNKMKNDISVQRHELHALVEQEMKALNDSKYSTWSESPSSVCASLSVCGHQISLLRNRVRALLTTQNLLGEAQEILGCASPILEQSDIDTFEDMNSLEEKFQIKSMTWGAVLDAVTISRKLLNSKLGGNIVSGLLKELEVPMSTYRYLTKLGEGGQVTEQLGKYVTGLRPTLEMVSFLTAPFHRSRHWAALEREILGHCGLALRPSDNAVGDSYLAVDITGPEPVLIGGFNSITISELINRGLGSFMNVMRTITVNACIEELLENTLNTIENTLNNATIVLSQDWLQDKKFREKIFFDLHRVTNCIQLNSILTYSLKTLLEVENFARETDVAIFIDRSSLLKNDILTMLTFVNLLSEIQTIWLGVFAFVKFSSSGELDRDTARLFQSCTEDLKKIEQVLHSATGLYGAYKKIISLEINAVHIHATLVGIAEDAHTNIQSLLDTCPRLSLLSYERLNALVKLWIVDPLQKIEFLSTCMQDMFDSVGMVLVTEEAGSRVRCCSGFMSEDGVERIMFPEPISMQLPLDEFVKTFEMQLRLLLAQGCDSLAQWRIIFFTSMFSQATIENIVLSTEGIFEQRMHLLESKVNDFRPNLCDSLIFESCFVEDVWLCLGFPVGCFVASKPELAGQSVTKNLEWKKSLIDLLKVCRHNSTSCLDKLNSIRNKVIVNTNTVAASTTAAAAVDSKSQYTRGKLIAMYSALYMQEYYHIEIIERLLLCRSLSSAVENWSAEIQLRLLCSSEERTRSSPFDITIDGYTVPHGLEYRGGHLSISSPSSLRDSVRVVLSAAYSNRGAVITHNDTLDGKLCESTVSCKDIANILGRISIHTPAADCGANGLRLFLSQLLYLDAIGFMELSLIDHKNLQILLNILAAIWLAIENCDDYYMVESVKYPLSTRHSRTALQLIRRKGNLAEFRQQMTIKNQSYSGLLLVGILNKSYYQDNTVVEKLVRSVFDISNVSSHQSLDRSSMKLAMIIAGFNHADSACTIYSAICNCSTSLSMSMLTKKLDNIACVRNVARKAGAILSIMRSIITNRFSSAKSNSKSDRRKQQAFQLREVEAECLISVIWEEILFLGGGLQENASQQLIELKRELLNVTKNILKDITIEIAGGGRAPTSKDLQLIEEAIPLSRLDRSFLLRSMQQLNLENDTTFEKQCGGLWHLLSSHTVRLLVTYGTSASGKTTLRRAVSLGLANKLVSEREDRREESRSGVNLGLGLSRFAWASLLIYKYVMTWRRKKMIGNLASSFLSQISNKADKRIDNINELNDQRIIPRSFPSSLWKEIVIFHGSLTTTQLMGSFDSQGGKWMDGILLRWLRTSSCSHFNSSIACSGSKVEDDNDFEYHRYVIVLDGPIGPCIEQMITSSSLSHTLTVSPLADRPQDRNCHQLAFSSGETLNISENTSIVIETNDLSQASPSWLSCAMVMLVTSSVESVIKMLTSTWMKSVTPSLCAAHTAWEIPVNMLRITLESHFIDEMLSVDPFPSGSQSIGNVGLLLSSTRVSSFLKYLGELLRTCHDLLLHDIDHSSELDRLQNLGSDATGVNRKSETEIDNEDIDNSKYELNSRIGVDLCRRVRLSITYAALWGFAGQGQCNNRSKFLDVVMRRILGSHFTDITLPTNCLLFELELSLDQFELRPFSSPVRLTEEHQLSQIITSPTTTSFDRGDNTTYQATDSQNTGGGGGDRKLSSMFAQVINDKSGVNVVFHIGRNRVVQQLLHIILKAGSNALLIGPEGCGKTFLLTSLLKELRSNCIATTNCKSDISNHLADIIVKNSSGKIGMPGILSDHQNVLHALKNSQSLHDDDADATSYLDRIQAFIENSPNHRCRRESVNAKNVFSIKTSLKTTSTSSELRDWLQSNLRTNSMSVLETPLQSHGIIFVEDLHLCLEDFPNISKNSIQQNLSQEFLRGVLQGTPSFEINIPANKKDTDINHHSYNSQKQGNVIDWWQFQPIPVVHCGLTYDTKKSSNLPDNFLLHQLGVICTATGQLKQMLSNSIGIDRLIPYFSVVSLPELTISDIHVLVSVGLQECLLPSPLFDALQDIRMEVKELSLITINIHKQLQLFTITEGAVFNQIENMMYPYTILDIGATSRFCSKFFLAAKRLDTSAAVLQVCSHEWKRMFVDPLPAGSMRDRVVQILRQQLDNIVPLKWRTTVDWIKILSAEIASPADAVWINTNGLCLTDGKEGGSEIACYLPIYSESVSGLKTMAPEEEIIASVASLTLAEESTVYATLDMNLLGGFDAAGIFHTRAIHFILRILRVITLRGFGSHIFLAGHFGAPLFPALQLAAKLCGIKLRSYTINDPSGVVPDSNPSPHTTLASDFRGFLKSCVLQTCGLVEVAAREGKSNIHSATPQRRDSAMMAINIENDTFLRSQQESLRCYVSVPPERILAVLLGSQHLTDMQSKELLKLMKFEDLSTLFDDNELSGIGIHFHQNDSSKAIKSRDKRRNSVMGMSNKSMIMQQHHHQHQKPVSPLDNSPAIVEADLLDIMRNKAVVEDVDEDESEVDDTSSAPSIRSSRRSSQMESTQGTFEPTKRQSISMEPITEMASAAFSEGSRTRAVGNQIAVNFLQCSAYHWVLRKICHSFKSRFILAMTAEYPLPVKLESQDEEEPSTEKHSSNAAPVDQMQSNQSNEAIGSENGSSKQGPGQPHAITSTATGNLDARSRGRANDPDISPRRQTTGKSISQCSVLSKFINRQCTVIYWEISAREVVTQVSRYKLFNSAILNINLQSGSDRRDNCRVLSLAMRPIGGLGNAEEIYILSESEKKSIFEDHPSISVLLQANRVPMEKQLSMITSLGVFKAYNADFVSVVADGMVLARSIDDVSGNNLNAVQLGVDSVIQLDSNEIYSTLSSVNDIIRSMLQDALRLLPKLLSLPTCSDTVLLSEHILVAGPDKVADDATEIVIAGIAVGARGLLIRSHVLHRAVAVLKEAQPIVDTAGQLMEILVSDVSEINSLIINCKDTLQRLVITEKNLTTSSHRSPEYELLLMMKEDITVHENFLRDTEMEFQKRDTLFRDRLRNYRVKDWQTWAVAFTSQPPQQYVELMKGILLLIAHHVSRTSRQKSTQDPNTILRLDDGGIIRASMSLLSSREFAQKVLDLDVRTFTHSEVHAMNRINRLLKGTKDFGKKRFYTDTAADLEEEDGKKDSKDYESSIRVYEDEHIPYHILRMYLSSLGASYRMHFGKEKLRMRLESIIEGYNRLNIDVNDRIQMSKVTLRKQNEDIASDIVLLEAELIANNEKISLLSNVLSDPESYQKMIEESMAYAASVIQQIESVLSTLVADICIAAVVSAKAAWLPESYRQKVLEQLRYEANIQKKLFFDSPFLLGSLQDIHQSRLWTGWHSNSLPRDIPSINSMSLLYLSPKFVFVIDPEGVADQSIVESLAADYIVQSIDSRSFTISLFRQWMSGSMRKSAVNTPGSNVNSLAVVLNDVQAGVSDDLIALLTADIYFANNIAAKRTPGEDTTDPSDGNKSSDLVFSFGTWNNSNDVITIPFAKLRIILISTKAPIMNSSGITNPLPAPCFRNMTIIHWSGSLTNSFVIDSSDLDRVTSKTSVADMMLEAKMTESLCIRLFSDHMQRLKSTNDRISSNTVEMQQNEHRALTEVIKWSLESEKELRDRNNTFEASAAMNKLYAGDRKPVYLGLLMSVPCCQILRSVMETRQIISKNVLDLLSQERDLLLYHSTLVETFGMPGEYFRMCLLLIPSKDFAPYSMTVSGICLNCIRANLTDNRLIQCVKNVPRTIAAASQFAYAVFLIQKFYRRHIWRKVLRDASCESEVKPGRRSRKSSIQRKDSPRRGSKLHRVVIAASTINKKQISYKISMDMLTQIKEGMQVLKLYLAPLRSFFMEQGIAYVNMSLRMKSEWRMKLALWLSTNIQTHSIQSNEIQAILAFMTGSKPMFAYVFNVSYHLGDTIFYDHWYDVTKFEETRSRGRTISSHYEKTFGMLTTAQKITAMFTKSATVISISKSLSSSKTKEESGDSNTIRKVLRGAGIIEGLFLHSRSTLWMLADGDDHAIAPLFDCQARWRVYLSDQYDSKLEKIKNNVTIIRSDYMIVNSFLVEWMSLAGAKSHIMSSLLTPDTVNAITINRSFAGRSIMSLLSMDGSARALKPVITHPQSQATHRRSTFRGRDARKTSTTAAMGIRKASFLAASSANVLGQAAVEELAIEMINLSENLLDVLYSALHDSDVNAATATTPTSKVVTPVASSTAPTAPITPGFGWGYSAKTMRLLEKHTTLSKIFLGVRSLLTKFHTSFMEWKRVVTSLGRILSSPLGTNDFAFLASYLRPPVPSDTKIGSSKTAGVDIGTWATGKELTVLQTLLFTAALLPNSLSHLVDYIHLATVEYLKIDGVIVAHEDEDYDDDDYDEGDVEDASNSRYNLFSDDKERLGSVDEENKDSIILSRPMRKNTSDNLMRKNSAGILTRQESMGVDYLDALLEESNDDDDDDISRTDSQIFNINLKDSPVNKVSYQASTSRRPMSRFVSTRLKTLSFVVNDWTILRSLLTGTVKPTTPKYFPTKSVHCLYLRDYENWENTIIFLVKFIKNNVGDIPIQSTDTAMASQFSKLYLFDDTYHRKNTYCDNKLSLMVPYYRNIAHSLSIRTLIVPGSSIFSSFDRYSLRDSLTDILKTIKAFSVQSSIKKRLLLEGLTLTSSADNILLSVLTTAGPRRRDSELFFKGSLNQGSSNSAMTGIVTALWTDCVDFPGRSPHRSILSLSSSWFPTYFLADLVGVQSDSWAKSKALSEASARQCERTLLNEMEAAFVIVKNSVKQMLSTCLPGTRKDSLLAVTTSDLKLVSSLVVLHKIILNINSVFRNIRGYPPFWSRFLLEPDAWTIGKLILKTQKLRNCNWIHRLDVMTKLASAAAASPLSPKKTNISKVGVDHITRTQELFSSLPLCNDKCLLKAVCHCVESLNPSLMAIPSAVAVKSHSGKEASQEKDREKDSDDASKLVSNNSSHGQVTQSTNHIPNSIDNVQPPSRRPSFAVKRIESTEVLLGNTKEMMSRSNANFDMSGASSNESSAAPILPRSNTRSDILVGNLNKGDSIDTKAALNKRQKNKSFINASSKSDVLRANSALNVIPKEGGNNSPIRSTAASPSKMADMSRASNLRIATGGRSNRIARVMAAAAAIELEEDEEELKLLWGGRKSRDRLISLSMVLFTKIVSISDNTDKGSSEVELFALTDEDIDAEGWPGFRSDRCDILLGGLTADIILDIMKNWIMSN